MGRKVWKPDYDRLAGYLREDMPPEIKIKFIQSLLHADSPEMSVQRILGVNSIEEAVCSKAYRFFFIARALIA